MFLMIDNYDSFTYNIVQYFQKSGEQVEVVLNDADISRIDFSKYTGIILSPGPSSPDNSGITLDILRNYDQFPILGVCLGMQALGYVNGGDIIKAQKIMHGKVDTVTHSGGVLFKNIPETFEAVRYHSLVISRKKTPECLKVNAYSSDGEIMAVEHKHRCIYGVQFHPESYASMFGMEIIKNFIGAAYEQQSINQ